MIIEYKNVGIIEQVETHGGAMCFISYDSTVGLQVCAKIDYKKAPWEINAM